MHKWVFMHEIHRNTMNTQNEEQKLKFKKIKIQKTQNIILEIKKIRYNY